MNKKVKSIVKSQLINTIYTIVLSKELNFPTGSFVVGINKFGAMVEIEEMFYSLSGEFICYAHCLDDTDNTIELDLNDLTISELLKVLKHITE